jgi:hypothetical protein
MQDLTLILTISLAGLLAIANIVFTALVFKFLRQRCESHDRLVGESYYHVKADSAAGATDAISTREHNRIIAGKLESESLEEEENLPEDADPTVYHDRSTGREYDILGGAELLGRGAV